MDAFLKKGKSKKTGSKETEIKQGKNKNQSSISSFVSKKHKTPVVTKKALNIQYSLNTKNVSLNFNTEEDVEMEIEEQSKENKLNYQPWVEK